MKNEYVVRDWIKGKTSSSDYMFTDGYNLYSFSLKIGYTSVDKKKIVYGYAAKYGHFVSVVTSQHVCLAVKYADRVEEVE